MTPMLEQIQASGPPAELAAAYPLDSAIMQAQQLFSAARTALIAIRGGT